MERYFINKTTKINIFIFFTLININIENIGSSEYFQSWHLSESNCNICHVSGDSTTVNDSHLLVESQPNLCQKCHKNSIRNSHPTGVAFDDTGESEFVADWQGELTCSGCHYIHKPIGEMNRSQKSGQQYCLSCHNIEFFNLMPDEGTSLVGFGHLDARSDGSELPIDKFSIQCIACHLMLEGTLSVGVSSTGVISHGSGDSSHPIGRSYDDARTFGGYRNKDALNKLIELPDDKIGCTSCHQGYSKQHGRLLLPMAGSQLCLECHNL